MPAREAGLGRDRVEGGKGAARIPMGIMLEIRIALGARLTQNRAKIDSGNIAVSQERELKIILRLPARLRPPEKSCPE